LADLRISRAAPLKWGISVIESGENPVILSTMPKLGRAFLVSRKLSREVGGYRSALEI